MGHVWREPSTRRKEGLQIEICDLCGRLCAADELFEATAQGLAGRRICNLHRELGTNPSHSDLQAAGGSMLPVKEELAPHSGQNWAMDRDATFAPVVTYLAFGISESPDYTYNFSADYTPGDFPVRVGDLIRVQDDNLGTVDLVVSALVSHTSNELYVFTATEAGLAGVWMDNPSILITRVYPE